MFCLGCVTSVLGLREGSLLLLFFTPVGCW